jgi:hypothetical protein
MTRFIYGGGGDGDIIQPSGAPYANATASVYNARTGGTSVTDLQNMSGAAITTVTTDSYGQAIFYGPDAYIGVLWLSFGVGPRWAISPKAVDLASAQAIAVQRAADFTGASFTTKAALPYHANDPLEQALASKLDPLVIPRVASQAARDAAFPSPVSGDRCWRTDLNTEQTYNGSLGVWRSTSFATSFGSVGGTVTVSNTATETALSGLSVPANSPAGATFRVTGYGNIIQAASTTPTVTFRLRVGGVGGTILGSGAFTAISNATPTLRAWRAVGHVTILTTGASGTWFGNLSTETSITSSGTLSSSDPAVRTDGTATATRDTTTLQSLHFGVQWGTASASNIVIQHGWFWERVC